MVSARETFSASPSISRLLSTSCVWTQRQVSISRIFSSRVPKRLSTPRMMRTLVFIEGILDTSRAGEKGAKKDAGTGALQKFDKPLARADEQHLESIIARGHQAQGSSSGGW